MTRVERRRQRQRQIVLRVCAGVGALAFLLACVLLLTGGGEAEETEPEPMETAEAVVETTPEPEAIDPLKADKEALARMVWGEARGCSTTEQAAVVWCALNRVDSADPFYPDDIIGVVTQANQFHGYNPDNPVEPELLSLVEDVLARWAAEGDGADAGRVLPKEYLFFSGDGYHNYFRTEWDGGSTWDWSLTSPYEEG
jgi:hypothetical protein